MDKDKRELDIIEEWITNYDSDSDSDHMSEGEREQLHDYHRSKRQFE